MVRPRSADSNAAKSGRAGHPRKGEPVVKKGGEKKKSAAVTKISSAPKKPRKSGNPMRSLKSAGQKIARGARVAAATGRLAARVANPKNARKMISDAVRGKGLVLPGSNYIGPGNPMGRKVKSKGDALAKKHDEDYEKYLKAGYSKKKVYGGYSDADERLRKKSDIKTPEGIATRLGMEAKRGLHKLTGSKMIKDETAAKRIVAKRSLVPSS